MEVSLSNQHALPSRLPQNRDLTKGRTRDNGAVKISCARQDPNARNCHGYRKFVKRSILEDPARGYLLVRRRACGATCCAAVLPCRLLSRSQRLCRHHLTPLPRRCNDDVLSHHTWRSLPS